MGSKQVYKYPTKRNLTRKDMTMRERILPEGANRFEVTTSDGLTLAGWTYGDKAKPTIVLVHGYPDNSCVWDGVVPLLAANWRVVTYDVRGCGESDVPAKVSDYRMAQLNADLKTIIDHVSPDEAVHVVGHDWGSIQSWNAMMDDDLKGRVKSYTSMSGISFDHVGQWLRQQFRQFKWRRGFGQLFRSWYFYMFHIPGLPQMAWKRRIGKMWPKMLEQAEGFTPDVNPHQVKDGVNGINLYRANFFPHVLRPNVRPVHVPVQIIVLMDDPYASPHLFSDHRKLVPELWRREVHAGHWLPLKDAPLTARMIDEFVTYQEGGPESHALERARKLGRANPDNVIDGKQALVTGAGSGIGRSSALKFAEAGADLILADIDFDSAKETARMVRDLGRRALVQQVDVSDPDALVALADWAETEAGPIDIVMNNAGIGMAGGFLETTRAAWERIIGINLWSVIDGGKIFAERMARDRRPGIIINTASAAGFTPMRIYPAYATTKAAVLMLSECQRADLADQGINVTAICPGFADTGIAKATEHIGVSDDEQADRRAKADAAYKRRALTPDTVAEAMMKGVRANKPVVLIGVEARLGRFIQRVMPWAGRKLAKLKMD